MGRWDLDWGIGTIRELGTWAEVDIVGGQWYIGTGYQTAEGTGEVSAFERCMRSVGVVVGNGHHIGVDHGLSAITRPPRVIGHGRASGYIARAPSDIKAPPPSPAAPTTTTYDTITYAHRIHSNTNLDMHKSESNHGHLAACASPAHPGTASAQVSNPAAFWLGEVVLWRPMAWK
ncbi:hypothetical protein CF319_g8109 [Tilletia indica]|nr:hypothetical protein CF319_g8109 [Tilletia indica]KAE8227385.1 hypothetical protein CF326_g7572 [Tilletia indica]